MRKILIIGAGQAGLQLGLSLQNRGYDVTIMSARTPDEIRNGRPTSTQVMFWPSLDLEREQGLNQWEDQAPRILAQRVSLAPVPGQLAFSAIGWWDQFAQSVDQRIKMSGWLELFESRGGQVIYHPVMTSDLAGLVPLYDLTVIAAGKGELVELFDRDPERSVFDKPQRMLGAIYLHGLDVMADSPEPQVRMSALPGVGELIYMPGLTKSGACHIMLIEGVPGGPFDRFQDRPGLDEHLRRLKDLLRENFPWEHELMANAEPTDSRATLVGAFAPTVRKPVAEMAPGAYVLGMGDVVVLNDPATGQGANNAAHCADIYFRSIVEHGDKPFDPEWMQKTFDAFWDYAQWPTTYTNTLISPLPEHVQRILGTAAQNPTVSHRFAYGAAHPEDLANWFLDPEKADAYLNSVAQ